MQRDLPRADVEPIVAACLVLRGGTDLGCISVKQKLKLHRGSLKAPMAKTISIGGASKLRLGRAAGTTKDVSAVL